MASRSHRVVLPEPDGPETSNKMPDRSCMEATYLSILISQDESESAVWQLLAECDLDDEADYCSLSL